MAGFQEFAGKTVVVTGGGSDIGAGLCRRFSALEMNVVVADVDFASAEDVASQLRDQGGRAKAVACDVSQRSQVESLGASSIDTFGAVGIACNNAGIFFDGQLRDFTEGDREWTMSVNLMGVVRPEDLT